MNSSTHYDETNGGLSQLLIAVRHHLLIYTRNCTDIRPQRENRGGDNIVGNHLSTYKDMHINTYPLPQNGILIIIFVCVGAGKNEYLDADAYQNTICVRYTTSDGS